MPARGQLGPQGGVARLLLAAVSWIPELSWDREAVQVWQVAPVQCPGPGLWLLWLRLLGEAPGAPPTRARGWHCPQACPGVAPYLQPLSTCHLPWDPGSLSSLQGHLAALFGRPGCWCLGPAKAVSIAREQCLEQGGAAPPGRPAPQGSLCCRSGARG